MVPRFALLLAFVLPLLPHVLTEMEHSALVRRSREINSRRSTVNKTRASQDEPIPLGLVGVLLEDNEAVQRYALRQEVLRIRQRVQAQTKGSSRG